MNPPEEQSYGAEVFERLRAEDEPWAERGYIETKNYAQIVGDQSMMISGGGGTGKTMLRLKLERELNPKGERPNSLGANWFPEPPDDHDTEDSQLSKIAFRQVMTACTQSLLAFIGHNPGMVEEAPGWTRKAAAWYFREYLPGDPTFIIETQAAKFPEEGRGILQDIVNAPPVEVIGSSASSKIILNFFVDTVTAMNLNGVWLLVDGLENWPMLDAQRLGEMMNATLSTLAIFEVPGFRYKVFVPEALSPYLLDTGGIMRSRVEPRELSWSQEELRQVVDHRFALISDDATTLDQLCSEEEFHTWIQRQADDTPRSHLKILARFVRRYLEIKKPLTAKDWHPIANYTSEILSIDLETNKVYIGLDEVEANISKPDLRVLVYLYNNRDRYCSLLELFHLAVNQKEKIPDILDSNWVDPAYCRDGLYNRISRLRKALNPEDSKLYIITESDEGYRLIHAGDFRQ